MEKIESKNELLLKVQCVFLNSYSPEKELRKITEFMSTAEIYKSLQKIYPSNEYSVDEIVLWLFENNFILVEMAPLSFKWGLRKK